jgi:hypothetical protein
VLWTVTVVLARLSDDAVAVSVMTVPAGAVTCTVMRTVQVLSAFMRLLSLQIVAQVDLAPRIAISYIFLTLSQKFDICESAV